MPRTLAVLSFAPSTDITLMVLNTPTLLISILINGCLSLSIAPLYGIDSQINYYSNREYNFYFLFFLLNRIRDRSHLVDAFNVDPLYLKHKAQNANEHVAPDFRVNYFIKICFIYFLFKINLN